MDNGIEYLEYCFPKNVSYFHLPIRGEEIYLNAKIGIRLIILLLNRKKYGLGLRGCYVAAIAEHIKPKIIVTMIDNNNWDLNLSPFLGIRILYMASNLRLPSHINNKHFDYFFAMSTAPADKNMPFNITYDEFCACGHIKAGLYLEKYSKQSSYPSNTNPSLLWISQFREIIYTSDETVHVQQKKTELMGLNYMSRYADEHGYAGRVAIASERKQRGKELELKYFTQATDGKAEFPDEFPDEWVSYHESKNACLVLGMFSTLLFESLSMGSRVIFIIPDCYPEFRSFVGQMVRLDLLSPLIYSGNDYDEFALKCNWILGMKEAEYINLIGEFRDTVAPLNPDYLPHHQVRDKISSIVLN